MFSWLAWNICVRVVVVIIITKAYSTTSAQYNKLNELNAYSSVFWSSRQIFSSLYVFNSHHNQLPNPQQNESAFPNLWCPCMAMLQHHCSAELMTIYVRHLAHCLALSWHKSGGYYHHYNKSLPFQVPNYINWYGKLHKMHCILPYLLEKNKLNII